MTADAERLDWLSRLIVEVRAPMLYGSRQVIFGAPGGDEETDMDEPWDLRGAIDKAMKKAAKAKEPTR